MLLICLHPPATVGDIFLLWLMLENLWFGRLRYIYVYLVSSMKIIFEILQFSHHRSFIFLTPSQILDFSTYSILLALHSCKLPAFLSKPSTLEASKPSHQTYLLTFQGYHNLSAMFCNVSETVFTQSRIYDQNMSGQLSHCTVDHISTVFCNRYLP